MTRGQGDGSAIPNALDGWSFTWVHGRELATMSDGTATWTNTYNADGLRTKRTNGSTTYSYVYTGSTLLSMTVGNDILYFNYDAAGIPLTVTWNGTAYYYATNLQGDVVAILDSTGAAVVTYTYDAWGNPISTTGTLATTLGQYNPLRYRGYVYDQETGLYYLQSRYYNPKVGRFINADGFTSTAQGFTGNNTFVYCGNNPICYNDTSGNRHCSATTISRESASDRSYSGYWQKQVALEKYNPEPIGSYDDGNVYLVTDEDDVLTDFPGDVVVIDERGPGRNDGVEIRYSFLITNSDAQREILVLLLDYETANPTGWNRTLESMLVEWDAHNDSHAILTLTPFTAYTERAAHVFFNNGEEGWSYWDHTVGRALTGK